MTRVRRVKIKLGIGVALWLIAAQFALFHVFWVTAVAFLVGHITLASGLWDLMGVINDREGKK